MNAPQIISDNQFKVKEALTAWAEWQRSDNLRLGYPSKSLMLSSGGGSSTFEDMIDTLDNSIAQAVEAILEGLSISQRMAVHHYHLNAVYRSNRSNIEDDYSTALMVIEFQLRRRGLL